MYRVHSSESKPNASIIDRSLSGTIDYLDSFCIDIPDADRDSIDYLTAMVFTSFPGWVWFLLKLRDLIVRPFGLETGLVPSQESIDPSVHFAVGERAIFFHVIDRNDSEIVMSEDDKHLFFRTSLMVDRSTAGDHVTIHLTTLVQYHHWWGKLYFLPVKPFHKAIMKTLLRQLAKRESHTLLYKEVSCD
jgi:hypothetical protein